MIGYSKQLVSLAVVLSTLAGFVDALGFITLGGFFVSFMSGNLTRFSVGFADGAWAHAATAGGVIVTFVAGVVMGAVVGRRFDHARRTRKFAVLTTVSLLLVVGSVAASADLTIVAVGAMILAMGAENAVFQRDGEVTIGLTYMTGALVKVGQRLAAAFMGGARWAWTRHLALVAGLVTGAVLGALAHRWIGLDALWFAAVVSVALAVTLRALPHTVLEPPPR